MQENHKEILLDILNRLVPAGLEVWAFGSRARWTARETSDLDLVLRSPAQLETRLEAGLLDDLKEAFEESDLPFMVDLLDWATVSEKFRKVIEREYVVVQKWQVGEMRKGWKICKLGELAQRITKGTTPTTLGYPFTETGINFIKAESILMDGSIDSSKFVFIDCETHEKLKRSQLEEGDILFSMAGMVLGKSAVVRREHLPANTNQALAIIRLKKDLALPLYVSYFMRQKAFFDYVNQSTGQSAQPNINLEEIGNLEIVLPSIPTQRRIAAILSSLDEKIELNRHANQTLEAISQTLFKEWFVDFNFPGSTGEMQESELGPIPVGWRVYKLEELIDTVSITHKFDKDEVVFLNTSDIESGKVLNHAYSKVEGLPGQAKKSIRKLDILFTEIRPANKRFALIDFDADDYVVSTKLMVLRTKVDIHPIVIYNYLTSDEVLSWLQHLAESRSGTFPQITFSQVKELKIALPTDDLLNAYVNIAWPAFEVVSNCDGETKALVEIRDSLLPKLMSGEIEV